MKFLLVFIVILIGSILSVTEYPKNKYLVGYIAGSLATVLLYWAH